jgi:hypothetical protein
MNSKTPPRKPSAGARAPNLRSAKGQSRAPRNAAQYHAKPEKFKDTWDRVVAVVSKLRTEKTSLQQASKDLGISPRTVKRWAGSALQKQSSGKWSANKSDTLLRVLTIPTPQGIREIAVRGSRQATQLAEYWNAVRHYLQTGDASRLAKFQGKSIKDANGIQIPLPTDRKELNRLGSAGVLFFESLYARSV